MKKYDIFFDDGEGTITYEKSYVETINGEYAEVYDDEIIISQSDKLMMSLLR